MKDLIKTEEHVQLATADEEHILESSALSTCTSVNGYKDGVMSGWTNTKWRSGSSHVLPSCVLVTNGQ